MTYIAEIFKSNALNTKEAEYDDYEWLKTSNWKKNSKKGNKKDNAIALCEKYEKEILNNANLDDGIYAVDITDSEGLHLWGGQWYEVKGGKVI